MKNLSEMTNREIVSKLRENFNLRAYGQQILSIEEQVELEREMQKRANAQYLKNGGAKLDNVMEKMIASNIIYGNNPNIAKYVLYAFGLNREDFDLNALWEFVKTKANTAKAGLGIPTILTDNILQLSNITKEMLCECYDENNDNWYKGNQDFCNGSYEYVLARCSKEALQHIASNTTDKDILGEIKSFVMPLMSR